MLEWLKRHAWKACIRQKRIPGSNPGLSAKEETDTWRIGFFSSPNRTVLTGQRILQVETLLPIPSQAFLEILFPS